MPNKKIAWLKKTQILTAILMIFDIYRIFYNNYFLKNKVKQCELEIISQLLIFSLGGYT